MRIGSIPRSASPRQLRPARRVQPLALATAAIALLCSACEHQREPGPVQRGSAIAFIGPHIGHPQADGVLAGARAAFARAPLVRATVVAPEGPGSEHLAAAADAALKHRPDVVCLFVEDSETAQPALRKLRDGRVLIVSFGPHDPDPLAVRHVKVDLAGAAELLGRNLEKNALDRRTYLLVHNDGRDPVATQVYRRFRSAERSTLTLLREFPATGDAQSQMRTVAEALDLFRNSGIIVTLDAAPWLYAPPGWLRELREINAEFRFATLSAAPALWARLGTPERPGEAAALAGPLDPQLGAAAAELAVSITVSPETAESNRLVPCHLVTAENLAEFAREYAAAGGDLDVRQFLPRGHEATP